MRRVPCIFVLAAVLLAGCGGETPETPPLSGVPETVSLPLTPVGEDQANPGEPETYRTGGSVSNIGHPIEYRFDFDFEGNHDFSAWSRADSATVTYGDTRTHRVAARARCAIHPSVMSQWSPPLTVLVGGFQPATEIVSILSTYTTGGRTFVDSIDFRDAIPDTVPYRSWITISYRGLDSGFSPVLCQDLINKCFRYQMSYFRESDVVPNFTYRSQWFPTDPVDTNPFGLIDSMTMNIGSVNYTIRARVTNISGMADPTPPEIPLLGNLAPTLDRQWLENYDGRVISSGDTVVFDWWAPADSGICLAPQIGLQKRFFFVIKAVGHDDPRERDGAGVPEWMYNFVRADNPAISQPFGRSGSWVGGFDATTLCDTFVFTACYAVDDTIGDGIFNNPPPWQDVTFEYRVQGRDLSRLESFEQYVYVNDGLRLVNAYAPAPAARRTAVGTMRFHIKLVR